MFQLLDEDITILGVLEKYIKLFKTSDDIAIELMQSLLQQIEDAQFYKTIEITNADHVGIKNVQFHLSNDCNLRCKHCYISAGIEHKKTLAKEQWLEILSHIHATLGPTKIIISGGEPLTVDYFFDIIKFAKKLGHSVDVFTNGLLINEENASSLFEYIDEIQISMEGITEKAYESIRGKGTYGHLLKALSLVKKYNVKLTLAITIIDSVAEDVNANIIQFLQDFDYYDSLSIRMDADLIASGSALKLPESYFHKTVEKRRFTKNIFKKLHDASYKIEGKFKRNTKTENCGLGNSIIIGADGTVNPCSLYDIGFGNVVEKPFQKIVAEFEELHVSTSVKEMTACQNCELRYICRGGCVFKNLEINGDMLIPVCDNKFKHEKYLDLYFDPNF